MKLRSLMIPLWVSLVAAGCAETKPEHAKTQHGLETATTTTPGDDRAEANEYERRMKRESADPTPIGPRIETVDWEEARGFRRIAPTALPDAQQKKLAAIRVPVLAFDDDTLLANGLVTHFENWYVLAVETGDGLNMNIRGTRNAMDVPGMVLSEEARKAAANYTLTRTHGIVTVSWRSFGVSYSLDIECAKPMDDARCTEDEFALELAESLGVIGGTP